MRRVKFLALTAIAGLGFASSAPRTHAQISVGIGVAPVCPYGYYDTLRTVALRTVITVLNGFRTGSLSVPAHGFMARNISMAMSTITTARITATTASIRITATGLVTGGMVPPSTSTETRCAMVTATLMTKDITRMLSLVPNKTRTRYLDWVIRRMGRGPIDLCPFHITQFSRFAVWYWSNDWRLSLTACNRDLRRLPHGGLQI